jgi:DNA topoisomerase I
LSRAERGLIAYLNACDSGTPIVRPKTKAA